MKTPDLPFISPITDSFTVKARFRVGGDVIQPPIDDLAGHVQHCEQDESADIERVVIVMADDFDEPLEDFKEYME